MLETEPTTRDLLAFIHASPTPRHCVAEVSRRLDADNFTALLEGDAWDLQPGERYYVAREGGIVAFRVGEAPACEAGLRLIGAHTDAPTLRLKPLADVTAHGYHQLGVEVYGGALTYAWLDRDLGLAGLVVLRREPGGATGDGPGGRVEQRLLRIDEPILRIPSLAIHLNRDLKEQGLQLNAQKHLAPILGLAPEPPAESTAAGAAQAKDQPGALKRLLAERLDVEPERLLAWELSANDYQAPTVGGVAGEFIFTPRLDNQAMCHAALLALLRADGQAATQLISLYDHEEVGSSTVAGAGGSLVESIMTRIAEHESPGAVPGGLPRAVAHSFQISADMAHAVHPNYPDQHEPQHLPRMNGGPVIKINAQQRYATGAEGEALFEALCQQADVPYQKFVNRTDLPCGSTIGPISAARLGVRTIDAGNAILSMHSIREQGGAQDPERMTQVMALFLGT